MYNISVIQDGLTSKYGRESGLDINEAVEEAIYYNVIKKRFTEEKLTKMLLSLEKGNAYTLPSDGIFQVRIERL